MVFNNSLLVSFVLQLGLIKRRGVRPWMGSRKRYAKR